MTARLLVIALDSADGGLLDRWTSDETLPCLAGIREAGSIKRLTAPRGISDDGLWACFQYSSGLGEHGRYHWEQKLRSGEMGMTYLDETHRKAFWEILSEQESRVAVVDIPKCGVPRPLNGIHLVDWLVHGRYLPKPGSFPEALADQVVARFGEAPPSHCGYHSPNLDDFGVRRVTRNLRASVSQKRDAALHLLASDSWDLFLVGFKEAHCAGHHLWNLVDQRHDEFDAARVNRLGDPVRTIFKDLDNAVRDLIAAAGDNVVVAVFSSSDMEPNSSLTHLMPGIVKAMNQELLKATKYDFWRRLIPGRKPQPVQLLPYNENCVALRMQTRLVEGSKSSTETQQARVLEQVEAMLYELTDLDSGLPVISSIDRPSADQKGPAASALPDLLVHCMPAVYPRAVVSTTFGRVSSERPPMRAGNHAHGGILFLTGASAAGIETLEDFGGFVAQVIGAGQRSP